MTDNLSAPRFKELVPSDTDTLEPAPFGIYVGTGGNVEAVDNYGNAATFANVPTGTTIAIAPHKIMATGTTASDLCALYED